MAEEAATVEDGEFEMCNIPKMLSLFMNFVDFLFCDSPISSSLR